MQRCKDAKMAGCKDAELRTMNGDRLNTCFIPYFAKGYVWFVNWFLVLFLCLVPP
jgi:hypothetical protein